MTRLSTAGAAVPTAARTGAPERRTTLLASKLAPPDPVHATVVRQRLLAQVTRGVQRSPLTLLSGPAGSGKTVLADSWRHSQGTERSIAWLTLDDYDDEPGIFWSYVVEALSGIGVRVSEFPAMVAGEPLPGWLVTRLAADLASCARPVVLVVDNADHITDHSIITGLDLLVRHAGNRLRLVMCGRSDPLLPLHQYRLAGTLAEVRSDELNFTPDETHQLFTAMGVPVAAEVARALCEETQGWAVGLRLAAAPLKQGVPPEQVVTSLARDDGSVAQYLFAEVLAGQPASVRRVLLRTSVTAELWPELVDRLCGRRNVRHVLAGLAHANAFVEESPGAPGGFRIHPLFREMLQAQLGYEHPAELASAHRTCAAWYAEAGRALEAIGHAVAAEDWGLVTRLLIDDLLVVRLLVHGTDPALRGLQSLPPGLRGPEAAVIRTVAALAAGEPPAPADLAASRAAQEQGHRLTLRVSATLADLTAVAATDLGPAELLGLGRRRGPPGRRTARGGGAGAAGVDGRAERPARRIAALRTDAPTAQLIAGLRAAAAAAQAAGARRLRCRAIGNLALLEATRGTPDPRRAARRGGGGVRRRGRRRRDLAGRGPGDGTGLGPPAALRARRGAGVAGSGAGAARDRAAGSGGVGPGPLLAVLQAQQFRLRHEYDLAEQTLRAHLQGPRQPRWIAEQVVTEVVRLAVARGHVEEGLAILRDRSSGEPWSRRMRATVGLLAGDPVTDMPAAARAHVVLGRGGRVGGGPGMPPAAGRFRGRRGRGTCRGARPGAPGDSCAGRSSTRRPRRAACCAPIPGCRRPVRGSTRRAGHNPVPACGAPRQRPRSPRSWRSRASVRWRCSGTWRRCSRPRRSRRPCSSR